MQTFGSETMNLARRYWGMELVRGIACIIFGILAIVWPHFTFSLFIVAFGIFAIVEGVILCINGFSQASQAKAGAGAGHSTLGNEGETYRSTLGAESSGYRGTTTGESGTARTASTSGTVRSGFGSGTGIYQRVTGRQSTNWGSMLIEGFLSIAVGVLCLIMPGFVGRLALYAVAAWAVFKGIGFFMQTQKRGWVMLVIGALAILLALYMFISPLSIVRTLLWIVGVFTLIMGVLLVLRAIQHNTSTSRTGQPRRPLEPTY